VTSAQDVSHGGRPCPITISDDALRTASDVRSFEFHISGARPADYLSSAYERLSQCAPASLEAKPANLPRSQIYAYAQEIGSFPRTDTSQRPSHPKAFETAVANLTIRYGSKVPDGQGTYYLPTIKITQHADRLRQWVSPSVTQPSLDNLCVNVGLFAGCASTHELKQSVPTGQTPQTYVSIQHYRVEFTVVLPASAGKLVANDVLQFIEEQNKGLAADQENLPTFLTKPSGARRSDDGNCNQASANAVRTSIDWTTKVDASTSPVLVVERDIPEGLGDIVSLSSLNHPFYKPGEVSVINMLNSPLPPPENDVGHAYHVAHTIGARGSANGWSGFAANADVKLTSLVNFLGTILPAKRDEITDSPNGPIHSFYRIINLSVELDDGVCEKSQLERNHLNYFLKFRQIVNDEGQIAHTFDAAPLYVFAASSVAATCKYTGDGGPRPRAYNLDNCFDLACLGQLPNAVTVIPLREDFQQVRQEARPDNTSLLLAAPGSGIFGADIDSSGEPGFRTRCGSSHATPIVSAVAAELASKYQLSAASIKSRLFATARLLETSRTKAGTQIHVVGLLDGDKAINSDPARDVVWLRPGAPPAPSKVEGAIVLYENAYLLTPPNGTITAAAGGGAPAANLIAIQRVPPAVGEIAVPVFRSLLREDTGGFALSSPYQLDRDATGASICTTAPSTNPSRPCLAIRRNDGVLQPIDLADVESIVFRDH
jgi:subtilisin family serine protease